jgi:hypothetical protein
MTTITLLVLVPAALGLMQDWRPSARPMTLQPPPLQSIPITPAGPSIMSQQHAQWFAGAVQNLMQNWQASAANSAMGGRFEQLMPDIQTQMPTGGGVLVQMNMDQARSPTGAIHTTFAGGHIVGAGFNSHRTYYDGFIADQNANGSLGLPPSGATRTPQYYWVTESGISGYAPPSWIHTEQAGDIMSRPPVQVPGFESILPSVAAADIINIAEAINAAVGADGSTNSHVSGEEAGSGAAAPGHDPFGFALAPGTNASDELLDEILEGMEGTPVPTTQPDPRLQPPNQRRRPPRPPRRERPRPPIIVPQSPSPAPSPPPPPPVPSCDLIYRENDPSNFLDNSAECSCCGAMIVDGFESNPHNTWCPTNPD